MNTETYDQVPLTADQVGEAKNFLPENETCDVLFLGDEPIGIELPSSVVMTGHAVRARREGRHGHRRDEAGDDGDGPRRQRAAVRQRGRQDQGQHQHRRVPGARLAAATGLHPPAIAESAHLFDNAGMQVYAVREITSYLRELFESSPVLGDVWVAGECSNVSRPSSGHVYFTLKDANAQFRRCSSRSASTCAREPRTSSRTGTPSSPTGASPCTSSAATCSLSSTSCSRRASARSRPSSSGCRRSSPKRACSTTRASARCRDAAAYRRRHVRVRRRLPRHLPGAPPTLAAGGGGARADARAGTGCRRRHRRRARAAAALGDIDVIIVARGGGSLEELWAFNDEAVARAIFASAVPVVSAVGHETDYTIADYVADVRAPTPSAAAEIVAPDRLQMQVRLGIAAGTMESVVHSILRSQEHAVRSKAELLQRWAPSVVSERQRVDELVRRAQGIAEHRQREATHGVGGCVWRLKSLSPYATLDRGYAIVQRAGAVVPSVSSVSPGDAIDVRVRDGSFGAVVGSGRSAPKTRARKKVPDAQAPLFSIPEDRA